MPRNRREHCCGVQKKDAVCSYGPKGSGNRRRRYQTCGTRAEWDEVGIYWKPVVLGPCNGFTTVFTDLGVLMRAKITGIAYVHMVKIQEKTKAEIFETVQVIFEEAVQTRSSDSNEKWSRLCTMAPNTPWQKSFMPAEVDFFDWFQLARLTQLESIVYWINKAVLSITTFLLSVVGIVRKLVEKWIEE